MDEKLKDDVKTLLDGDGTPATDASTGVLETRPGQCEVHGDYVDQRVSIRVYVGFKPVPIPYWLGCPECRREADVANDLEAKRWLHLLPGEASWTVH